MDNGFQRILSTFFVHSKKITLAAELITLFICCFFLVLFVRLHTHFVHVNSGCISSVLRDEIEREAQKQQINFNHTFKNETNIVPYTPKRIKVWRIIFQ